jgi:ribosomal protein S18 acetylase RimI-like enzyme
MPKPSDAITVRLLQSGDENLARVAITTLKPEEERNGNIPDVEYMESFLASERNLLVVALDAAEPVGFCLAYRLMRADRDADMICLYEIDVAKGHRRRGIGRRMIAQLKAAVAGGKLMKMWATAECTNIPAIRLYQTTGARKDPEVPVLEFVYRDL